MQLDFQLNPYSPYIDGYYILEQSENIALYPNYTTLLNGVCMSTFMFSFVVIGML